MQNKQETSMFDPGVMKLLFMVIDILCVGLIVFSIVHVHKEMALKKNNNQGDIVITDSATVKDANASFDSKQEVSVSGASSSEFAEYEGFDILKSNAPYALLLQSHKKLMSYAEDQGLTFTKAVLDQDSFSKDSNGNITYTVTLTLDDGTEQKAYARYDGNEMTLTYSAVQ